jgi:hypothetical protein
MQSQYDSIWRKILDEVGKNLTINQLEQRREIDSNLLRRISDHSHH